MFNNCLLGSIILNPREKSSMRVVCKICVNLTLFLIVIMGAHTRAESDGQEFLNFLKNSNTRVVAMAHIDDVWKKWDDTLFCMQITDIDRKSEMAASAVEFYLEQNPDQHFRPRRYLIIQALRTKFPC